MSRFLDALERIDAANAEDPNWILVDGSMQPAELVYGRRMSEMLRRLVADPSESLALAVRAQHLRRFSEPRASYPAGRAGYLRWRNDLKRKHALWTAEILAACGYDEATIARVGALIRKEGLKSDPEAQTLEDAACLVFLAHGALDFAQRHEPDKVVAILAKTWGKMSETGRAAALRLDLAPPVRSLLDQATAQASDAGSSEEPAAS